MILHEVENLYKVIQLRPLRRTVNVVFDALDMDDIPRIDACDRVLHQPGAVSPGPVDGIERPWYMHPHQQDNLMVLHGVRYVDIYTPAHGQVESITVTPDKVTLTNGTSYEGGAMLVWACNVFHRIRSCPEVGSASLNFAVHYEGFDIKTNFNIYDLDTQIGQYRVIREGHLDQP